MFQVEAVEMLAPEQHHSTKIQQKDTVVHIDFGFQFMDSTVLIPVSLLPFLNGIGTEFVKAFSSAKHQATLLKTIRKPGVDSKTKSRK